MAFDLRDRFDLHLEHDSPLAGKIAKPLPELVTDKVHVTLDSLYQPGQPFKQGPLRWMPRGDTLPSVGDHCLVVADETGELWVIAWWPA